MKKGLKKGLAVALCACLAVTTLGGCKKKSERDNSAAMLSLEDGGQISVGAANVYLRYQQAEFENGFGQFIKSYYGGLWDADLTGSGEAYGNTFKEQILEGMQHMLLAQKHAADFNVEVTADEKTAISQAAESFMAENGQEVLDRIGASQESVEEMLTLYTVMTKMETEMGADVDTEVSDEEAAQRKVSYVYFNASVDEEEEEETGLIEEMSEGVAEAAGMAEEALSEAGEAVQAAAEEESEVKTQSADTAETVSEAVSEAAEASSEAVEEAAVEAVTEAETETESPEMQAARAEAQARAEAFLARVQSGEDFTAAAQAAQADETQKAYTSTFTFGDDDTYPSEEIREATKGLEDGAIVDHVVVVGTSYYVLRVDDAFDEDATEQKKLDIVEQRRNDAVEALYTEWENESSFSLNSEDWTSLIFDVALNYPEAETEALSEAATEGGEGVAESATEA